MDIKEYIASGIIESHVLGLTSEEEVRELKNMCAQYPEVREALTLAETATESYASLHAKTPPASTKDKIWAALQKEEGNEEETQSHAVSDDSQEATLSKKPAVNLYRIIAIAAMLVLALGIAFHFYRVNLFKQQIETLKVEKLDLITQNSTYQAQISQAKSNMDIVMNPEMKSVVLSGVKGHEDLKAMVYWKNDTKEVYLMPMEMPAAPEGKQYQLWAIVDGKPVNAGMYDGKSAIRLQKMLTMQKAEMFAITLENEGGSEQPTLDQMMVAGKT